MMANVRVWVQAGCDPEHQLAPPIEVLDRLERDDLIVSVSTIGDKFPRWLLTPRGEYEAQRVFAERYRVDGES